MEENGNERLWAYIFWTWYTGLSSSGISLFFLSKFVSLHLIFVQVGEALETLTTRVAPLDGLISDDLMSLDIINEVKRKCPMWFVANWISIPSSVRVRSGVHIMPALLTMMSRVGTSVHESNSDAAARTAFWLERSSMRRR